VPAVTEELAVRSAEEMRALGRRLAGRLRPGDLVVLNGPLGAGKTTLVQGIGEGMEVRGPITSPTFVIARVHPPLGRAPSGGCSPGHPLVHVDAYRLGGVAEVDDLDLDADLERAVTVVEWGGGLVEALAGERLEISIALDRGSGSGEDDRVVRIEGIGARWDPATSPPSSSPPDS
jgi:tRNA threonylcarbamoyladenosine biosynthesis protein TsaE